MLDDGQIREPWKLSTTPLFPKEGENKEDIANYCPIVFLTMKFSQLLLLKDLGKFFLLF